jgi:hypothetical protein
MQNTLAQNILQKIPGTLAGNNARKFPAPYGEKRLQNSSLPHAAKVL